MNAGPSPELVEEDPSRSVVLLYTNHRGETAMRRVLPMAVVFSATEWYPEEQWLLIAYDFDRRDQRHFAMRQIHGWAFSGSAPPAHEIVAASYRRQLELHQADAERAYARVTDLEALLAEAQAETTQLRARLEKQDRDRDDLLG